MLRYVQGIAQTSLRWIGSLPKPLLVTAYLSFFVLWFALVAATLNLWQDRQVMIEQRRQQAARLYADSTAEPPRESDGTDNLVSASSVHPKTGRVVAAWLPTSFDATKARASFQANKDVLDEVSPFWYAARKDGTLRAENGARDRTLVQAAHDADVLVIPTIHNVDDVGAVIDVINDLNRRARHIEVIVDEVLEHNYDGIDIDYEALPTSSRDDFSAFIEELADALHAEGKLLTVAVHAKDSDFGGLGGFQDWERLGAACDRVRIMTYDFHWRGSGPGPIAPIHWVESVAAYARSVMPAHKIELGIPFYGYNWGSSGKAVPQTWSEIQGLIKRYNPRVHVAARDERGAVEESWFTYRSGNETRTVWFNDRRSMDAKLALIEKLDLAGIAIWRLGSEDPANWQSVREQLGGHSLEMQRAFNDALPKH